MNITPIPCQDEIALQLIQQSTRNFSDDTAPFHMSQLQLFDLQTRSPITKQTIEAALTLTMENLPEGIFKEYQDEYAFEDGKLKDTSWCFHEKEAFEPLFKGWLCNYKEQVRSPIRKEAYGEFVTKLYHYLGYPKFFVSRRSLFKTPNYYCLDVNVLIATQNHTKFPVDKLALFTFFCPD